MRLWRVLSFLPLFLALAAPAWAAPVGQVITVKPEANAQRDGQKLPLNLKDSIEARDTLTTDQNGRLQIMFEDDSAATLGPDTTFTVEELRSGGKQPSMKAKMGQGLMRFVTGKVVEQNPEGFAITTPEATIGIRGTIFIIMSRNGQTTLYVTSSKQAAVINGIPVREGYKITVPGQSAPEPMTPAEMEEIDIILNGDPSQVTRRQPLELLEYWVMNWGEPGGDLAEILDGGSLINTGPPPLTNASLSGALSPGAGLDYNSSWTGNFNFDVNLVSGAITGASMSGASTTPGGAFSLSGGAGLMDSGNTPLSRGFTINNFSGAYSYNGVNHTVNPAATNMTGSAVGNPINVGGTFDIVDSGANSRLSGTFSGSQP